MGYNFKKVNSFIGERGETFHSTNTTEWGKMKLLPIGLCSDHLFLLEKQWTQFLQGTTEETELSIVQGYTQYCLA